MSEARGSDNRYEIAAIALALAADVEVRHYRSRNTGVARSDGTIDAPHPRGPISFGTFAHEVGHVVLGHTRSNKTPRWQEEVEAWEFALKCLQEFDLPGYERVERDAAKALSYSFAKAIRRGVDPWTIEERYPTWWALANPGPLS